MASIASYLSVISSSTRGEAVRDAFTDACLKLVAEKLPTVSSADSGKYLMVTSGGKWAALSYSPEPDPSDVTHPETCTIIPSSAFKNSSITSASFPVASIMGNDAFYGCASLTTIAFPEMLTIGDSAFLSCSALSDATFQKAASIGAYAFMDCYALATVSLPKATDIGSSAFYGCSSLMSLYVYTSTVPTLYDNAFAGTPLADSSYTGTFGSIYVLSSMVSAFASASYWSLFSERIVGYSSSVAPTPTPDPSDVTHPETCEYIPNMAFINSTITSASFPIAETIFNSAFYSCSSLSIVSFPELKTIYDYAFARCNSLSEVSFPKAERVWEGVFANCHALEKVSLPEASIVYSYAFDYCYSLSQIYLPKAQDIGRGAFSECSSLSSISLPEAVDLGEQAFKSCISLKTVDLPKVGSILSDCFYRCNSLENVSIPNVSFVGYGAFYECSLLSVLYLPNVDYISEHAFDGCVSLESLYILAESVPTLNATLAFYRTPITSMSYLSDRFGSIYVRSSLINLFFTAENWSKLAPRITIYSGSL